MFDVRTGGRLLHLDNAHDAPVTSIVQTGSEVMCITASLDGSSKPGISRTGATAWFAGCTAGAWRQPCACRRMTTLIWSSR